MSGARSSTRRPAQGRNIRRPEKPSAAARTQNPAPRFAPSLPLLSVLAALSVLVLAV